MTEIKVRLKFDVQDLEDRLREAFGNAFNIGSGIARDIVTSWGEFQRVIARAIRQVYESAGKVRLKFDVQDLEDRLREAFGNAFNIGSGIARNIVTSWGEFQRVIARAIRQVYESAGIVLMIDLVREINNKFGRMSGYLRAAVELLDTFVNLMFKPFADLIGVVLIPLLIPLIQALLPVVRWWNENIAKPWLEIARDNPLFAATPLLGGILGFMLGGPAGGVIGFLTPMLINAVFDWLGRHFNIEVPDWLREFVSVGGTLWILVDGLKKLAGPIETLNQKLFSLANVSENTVVALSSLSRVLSGLATALGVGAVSYEMGRSFGRMFGEYITGIGYEGFTEPVWGETVTLTFGGSLRTREIDLSNVNLIPGQSAGGNVTLNIYLGGSDFNDLLAYRKYSTTAGGSR